MKIVTKQQPVEILETGDVIEQLVFDRVAARYLVIQTQTELYQLVGLEHFELIDEFFEDIDEVLNYVSDIKYRIIKSSDLEMREI